MRMVASSAQAASVQAKYAVTSNTTRERKLCHIVRKPLDCMAADLGSPTSESASEGLHDAVQKQIDTHRWTQRRHVCVCRRAIRS